MSISILTSACWVQDTQLRAPLRMIQVIKSYKKSSQLFITKRFYHKCKVDPKGVQVSR